MNDIKSFDGIYKTVVIGTMCAMIEYMKDWAMRTEPSASKKSGGFSQQGYGFVKAEFLRLSAELRKKLNVIFLFHAAKDKSEEKVFAILPEREICTQRERGTDNIFYLQGCFG